MVMRESLPGSITRFQMKRIFLPFPIVLPFSPSFTLSHLKATDVISFYFQSVEIFIASQGDYVRKKTEVYIYIVYIQIISLWNT